MAPGAAELIVEQVFGRIRPGYRLHDQLRRAEAPAPG
jgi:hypothetical protein